MFGIMGYNLMFDSKALDATPNNVLDITKTEIRHGVFDHFNVTKDVTSPWTGVKPTEWGVDTIMDADFDGNINAGNIGFVAGAVTGVRLKRRELNDVEENWITLLELPVYEPSDLNFTYIDHFNQDQVWYVYALFPVITQDQDGVEIEVEGAPTESEPIFSEVDGVFVVDSDDYYRLDANVNYDTLESNHETGVHATLGNQYPVVAANAKTNYKTGGVSGTIVNQEVYELGGGSPDRHKIREEREKATEFFMNHKPKILKDWNGNMWLIYIQDNVYFNFTQNWGMGIGEIGFKFAELGNAKDENALRKAGLIKGGV